MYVYIIHVYMSNSYTYVQSIYIWIMLVGNYSVNKNYKHCKTHKVQAIHLWPLPYVVT